MNFFSHFIHGFYIMPVLVLLVPLCIRRSGFTLSAGNTYLWARRGAKEVKQRTAGNQDHVSVISAVSASGEHLPPFFVFTGKKKSSAKLDQFTSPPEFEMSESGYANDEVGIALLPSILGDDAHALPS